MCLSVRLHAQNCVLNVMKALLTGSSLILISWEKSSLENIGYIRPGGSLIFSPN